MNRIALTIFYINLIGLAVCQGLESWRWGTISAVVPFGWVWLGSIILFGVTMLVLSKNKTP